MDDVIRIIKSLENLSVLIDGVTETVNHEVKKHEVLFLDTLLAPTTASLVAPMASSLVKDIFGKGVIRAGRGYSNMDHMDKNNF